MNTWPDGGMTPFLDNDDMVLAATAVATYPEEAPAHEVTVDGFRIDRHAVTNDEFARFVRKTGHVTVAEQAPDPADYPAPGRSCWSRPRRSSRTPATGST